jgi:hypothetical protein
MLRLKLRSSLCPLGHDDDIIAESAWEEIIDEFFESYLLFASG